MTHPLESLECEEWGHLQLIKVLSRQLGLWRCLLFFYCKPRAVGKLCLVDISKHYNWHGDFQLLYAQWHSWHIDKIQKFYWIINHFIFFHNNVDGLVYEYLALNVTMNNVRFVNVFVLGCKNIVFPQPIRIFYNWFEYWQIFFQPSFDVSKLHKFWSNEIPPEVRSTVTLTFKNSNNWCVTIANDRSFSASHTYL